MLVEVAQRLEALKLISHCSQVALKIGHADIGKHACGDGGRGSKSCVSAANKVA